MVRRPAAAALILLIGIAGTAHAQSADPKSRFVQALAQFSLALDGSYGDEGPRIVASLEALERSVAQWDDAIRDYEAAVSKNSPGDPKVAARMHVGLGGLYLDRARLADAIREFDAALALDSSQPDMFMLRALASSAAHDTRGAAAAFKKAFDLDPRNAARAYLWARSLTQAGNPDDAKAAFRLVSEQKQDGDRLADRAPFMRFGLVEERTGVEPFFPPAQYAEAFARLGRGDLVRAIAAFRTSANQDVLISSEVSRSYAVRKAAEAFRGGDVAAAVSQLQAAIELHPDSAEPHRLLGLVYAADEQYERGISELKAAVSINPGDERSRLALADVLDRAERPPAAEEALRSAIAAIPASGRAHYLLARVLQRQGRQAEAIVELERATGFAPLLGLNGMYQTLGALHAALQQFDQAIDAYSHRVDLQPNDAAAHQDLGDTYARLGRDDEALAEFAIALRLEPRRAAAFGAIAQVRLRNGAYEDAAAAARRAIDIDPVSSQAHYTLGTALLRLEKADEGQKELETFQRLQSEIAAARARDLELGGLRREASVSSAAGDHKKAVTLLRHALEIAPNEMVSHLNLGIALVLAGEPAEAIEKFASALALNGPDDIHERLAQAYAALGRNDESRRELELYEQLKQRRLQNAGAER